MSKTSKAVRVLGWAGLLLALVVVLALTVSGKVPPLPYDAVGADASTV